MITITYLYFFMIFSFLFLTLGFIKKQYALIFISSIFLLFISLNSLTGVELRTIVNSTITSGATTSYTYTTVLMDSLFARSLTSVFFLISIALMIMSVYFLFKKADTLEEENNNDE